MVPTPGGTLFTSSLSGQLISRWERYRHIPGHGTAGMAAGRFRLFRMDAQTSVARASYDRMVLGWAWEW